MAGRSVVDTIKSDNILVDLLAEHKGKEKVISSRAIAEHLTACGYPIKAACVSVKIGRVMFERHLPICHLNSHGYYWASCKAELRESIADLESRIVAMQEHIEHLKSFIFD